MSEWMSVKDAAAATGFREAQIYLWVAEKRIRHLRLGRVGCRGSISVTLKDIHEFIESQVVEPQPVKPAKPARKHGGGTYRHLDPKRIGSTASTVMTKKG